MLAYSVRKHGQEYAAAFYGNKYDEVPTHHHKRVLVFSCTKIGPDYTFF